MLVWKQIIDEIQIDSIIRIFPMHSTAIGTCCLVPFMPIWATVCASLHRRQEALIETQL